MSVNSTTNSTTVNLLVNSVWTALGDGKGLHPRINKETVKAKIVTAVENVLLDNTGSNIKTDLQA